MNTPVTPWIDLTLHQAQRAYHLAWFLYGWVEREQVLNLEACVAWWLRAAAVAPGRGPYKVTDRVEARVLARNVTAVSRR